MDYLKIVACVVLLMAGQVLFKVSANAMRSHALLSSDVLLPLLTALLIYAVATVCWVWALVRIELSLAYPLMALGFVLLPLISVFIFREHLTPINFLGLALISVGVALSQIR